MKTVAPRGLSPFGAVLRIDIEDLLSDKSIPSLRVAQDLVAAIVATLNQSSFGYMEWWAPAPGVVDIHHGNSAGPAAELRHSVVTGAIGRCIREKKLETLSRLQPAPAQGAHRVDPETFQQICAKHGARPDQIQSLDAGEILFNDAAGTPPLIERTWARIDAIVDQSMDRGGYVTRPAPNQLLLFFPGLSKGLAETKASEIAAEIVRSLTQPAGAPAPRDARRSPAQAGAVKPSAERKPARLQKAMDREADELNRAVAAVTARREGELREWERAARPAPEPWLNMGPNCDIQAADLWCASSRVVCGQVLAPVRRVAGAWIRSVPEDFANADWLDHFLLKRGAQRVSDGLARGAANLTVVPVQWQQLDRPQLRARYLDLGAAQHESLRRLLVLELCDIPHDIIASRVEERIRQLRRICRAVICRMRLSGRNFAQLNSDFVYAAGVHLTSESGGGDDLFEAMNRFAATCDKLRLKTYVHGVERRRQLLPALAAGADYIAGAVIPSAQGAQSGLREVSIYELLGTNDVNQARAAEAAADVPA